MSWLVDERDSKGGVGGFGVSGKGVRGWWRWWAGRWLLEEGVGGLVCWRRERVVTRQRENGEGDGRIRRFW